MVTIDQLAAACDERTRAIGIASVSFATGDKVDLGAISRFCEEKGILLLVDAVQSLGIHDFSVRRTPVAAAAAATSKGLLGLYGLGVLYVRKELAARLHPNYLARYSVDLGDSHEEVLGDFSYALAAGARRFEVGNWNYLALHALEAGIDQVAAIGVKEIERHVVGLAAALSRGVEELGYVLRSPRPDDAPEAVSHIVILTPGHGRPGGKWPSVREVSNQLKAAGIRHSVRRGGLRLSFHMYNNMGDVGVILDTLKRARPD